MASLEETIPGLREAEGNFREYLMEGFLGVEPDICGAIGVLPLTPQMYIELEACGNALCTNRPATPVDVAVFLWRVNPGFFRTDQELRLKFNQCVAMLPWERTLLDCYAYMKRAWQGMPQWKTGKGPASAGVWPSRIVHMLATEYGWRDDYILNLPFRRLWQYANRILETNDRDYVQKAPGAMELRAKWLKERREERERSRTLHTRN